MTSFGSLMRELRERCHVPTSLGVIARGIGVTVAYLSAVEAGKKLPTVERVIGIARWIGDHDDLESLLTAAGKDRGSLDVPWPDESLLAQRVLVALAALGPGCRDGEVGDALREAMQGGGR